MNYVKYVLIVFASVLVIAGVIFVVYRIGSNLEEPPVAEIMLPAEDNSPEIITEDIQEEVVEEEIVIEEVIEEVVVIEEPQLDIQTEALLQQAGSAMAFSADGEFMLTTSADGVLRIWEVFTGKQVHVFETKVTIPAAIFSPDGTRVAAASTDGSIRIFDISGETIRLTIKTGKNISSLNYNANGRELISLGADGELQYWNSTNGALLRREASGISAFTCAGLGVGAEQILYARDNTVILGARGGKELRRFPELNKPVLSLALSSNGAMAAASTGENIVMWNLKDDTSKIVRGSAETHALAFYKDNSLLLSGSTDGKARLWDIENMQELAQYIGFQDKEWITMVPTGFYNLNSARN